MFGQANKELKQLSKWVENTLKKGQVFLSSKWLITKLNDQVATSSCWRNLGRTNSLGKKDVPPKMPNAESPTGKLVGGRSATRRNLDHFSEHLSVKCTMSNPLDLVVPKSERSGRTPGTRCNVSSRIFPPNNSYNELVRIPCEQFQKPIGKSLIMVS